MKIRKYTAALLILLLCLSLTAASAAGTWICPNCGRMGNSGNFCPNCATPRPDGTWTCLSCGQTDNTGNFCPNCAAPRPGTLPVPTVRPTPLPTPRPTRVPTQPPRASTATGSGGGAVSQDDGVTISTAYGSSPADSGGITVETTLSGSYTTGSGTDGGTTTVSGVRAKLKKKLVTRSGPGTLYDEVGAFFAGNWRETTVTVLGKDQDSSDGSWWVYIEFKSGNKKYRAWTEQSRVDVKIASIQQVYSMGQGTMSATPAYYGPGTDYAVAKKVPRWQDVVVYGAENGYLEVEYYDENTGLIRRCWVAESDCQIDWGWTGGFG